jgi:hypothetical protein
MDILAQVIVFTIPALVVGVVAYLLIDKLLKAENNRRNYELQKSLVKTITPSKLTAYERMTLFLERITPESLLARQEYSGLTVIQLQSALLQQIRQEWEHNLTQQLYITQETWMMVRNAKESMIQLINTCAAKSSGNSTAIEFATMIIETYQSLEKTPVQVALSMLKADVARLG